MALPESEGDRLRRAPAADPRLCKAWLALAACRVRVGLSDEAREGAAPRGDIRLFRSRLSLQGRHIRLQGDPGWVCDDQSADRCGVRLLAPRSGHAPRLALVPEPGRPLRRDEPTDAPLQPRLTSAGR